MSGVTAAKLQEEDATTDSPILLRELEPWHRVFFRNLADVVLRREPPPVEITATPVPLRRDYFIQTGIDPARYLESYGGHIAVIALVYLVCTLPFFNRTPQLNSPYQNTEITYYPVSDYLPPINTAAKAAMKPRRGAPKLAKQEILSVPQNPDNTHQTIVTPPRIKLNHDVPLPNIVAWTPIPSAQPVAASARSVSQLKVPQFEPDVAAPTADVSKIHAKLDLRVAHRIHVDNVVEIADVGAQEIVFVGCGCTQRVGKLSALNTSEVALEKNIGFRFNPRSHARIRRSSMRRVVFKASVVGRIVRRRDYDTVGKS